MSDKISAETGAKIIEKLPKNSHKKYTMWQTESIFKQKIKSSLDFLLDRCSSIDGFLLKAKALDLSVSFAGKWATYCLLDEAQVNNTRSRNLSKNDPEKYNFDRIVQYIKDNKAYLSLEDVVKQCQEMDWTKRK